MSNKAKLMMVGFLVAVSLGSLVPAAAADDQNGLVHVNGERLVRTDSRFQNRDLDRVWNRDVHRVVDRDAARLVDGAADILTAVVNPR